MTNLYIVPLATVILRKLNRIGGGQKAGAGTSAKASHMVRGAFNQFLKTPLNGDIVSTCVSCTVCGCLVSCVV